MRPPRGLAWAVLLFAAYGVCGEAAMPATGVRSLLTDELPIHECDAEVHSLSSAQYAVSDSTLERCNQQCDSKPECMMACMKKQAEHHYHAKLALKPDSLIKDHKDMVFVVWYAVGNKGAEFFDSHQFVTPDMNFASAVWKTHPGARVVMMTDQTTQLQVSEGVDIFRFTIDKEKFGRNKWGNYYQYKAQIAFLERLKAENSNSNVVFMDMDILVVDSISEIFCRPFDYAVTLSDSIDQPINLGMQFVHKDRYDKAIEFIKVVVDGYRLDDDATFTAGQTAISDALHITWKRSEILDLHDLAFKNNRECIQLDGKLDVCFLPSIRYNFWEDCMAEHTPQPLNVTSAKSYAHNGVKAIHFIAYRKKGFDQVHTAFMQHGLQAAYEEYAALPHDEEGYKEREKARQAAAKAAAGEAKEEEGEGVLANGDKSSTRKHKRSSHKRQMLS